MSAPEAPNFDLEMQEPSPPRKRGRWKWVLGILLGLCLTCCCGIGGLGFFIWRHFEFSTDPQVASRRAAEIIEFEAPQGMQAVWSMRFPVGEQRITEIFWVDGESKPPGFLVLAEAPEGASPDEVWRTADDQMDMLVEATLNDSSKKSFTVRGEEVEFQFAKGTSKGKPIRQVRGVVPSKGGRALIHLRVAEDRYDEAKVEAMLRSME